MFPLWLIVAIKNLLKKTMFLCVSVFLEQKTVYVIAFICAYELFINVTFSFADLKGNDVFVTVSI